MSGGPEDDHYAHFEALPDLFRRLLMYADENYQCWWVERYIASFGPAKAAQLVRHDFAVRRRVLLIDNYGPSHPQLVR